MARIISDLMSPDQLPAPRTMARLFEKPPSRDKAENNEPVQREAVEEVTL